MALKLALSGALGRMGRRIADLAANAGHEILFPVDLNEIGKVYGEVIGDRRQQAKLVGEYAGGADLLIDFSLPQGFDARLRECVKHSTPLVSGTTGLSEEQHQALEAAAKTIPVLWAPNMSVGVNLLFSLARQVASKLPESYEIEIVEMHHRRKIDAPSGTAMGLLRAVCDGNGRDPAKVVRHGREGETGERTPTEIGMHSLRGGDVVGEHTVIFAGDGERIELSHKASSRDAFASGAIRAAEWLASKDPGLYGMAEVLSEV